MVDSWIAHFISLRVKSVLLTIENSSRGGMSITIASKVSQGEIKS